ncbi:hypothetical protein EJ06DRAFT_361138 [Trichodelitschia bisporula]|uniref:Uncharacterized protein n=1 Tax=Trichodelitschia bisporula TaxID=703511 RepID=A0A6G1I0S7_9PEZI|nr:hypothetical protein EJ06DRAFT_361138 [Trichodelitschia bisporula]
MRSESIRPSVILPRGWESHFQAKQSKSLHASPYHILPAATALALIACGQWSNLVRPEKHRKLRGAGTAPTSHLLEQEYRLNAKMV